MIWLLPFDSDHPSRHLPWATWALMAINIAAYALMPGGSDDQVRAWYLEWGLISGDPHWYQFITSAFMHGSWGHLIGNMFFLWVLGDNVEDAIGTGGFLLLYLVGGFLGDALYVVANDAMIPSVGASGCIAAIAGAYAVLFFRHTIALKLIVVVFPVYTLRLQAIWVLLLFFGMDVFMTIDGKGAMDGGGVNFVAHGAGFLAGVAVGVLARMLGAMRRFESLGNGDPWWGYLPPRLDEEMRLAKLREMKRQRLADEVRRG